MADPDTQPFPEDFRDLGPMRPYRGRRSFDIKDPIVEPFWSGTRALAHVTVRPHEEPPVRVALIESSGLDLAAELPDVTEAIARGVLAVEAIVDGVISRQVMLDGTGAAAVPEVHSRPTEMFLRNDLDFDVKPRGAIEEHIEAAETIDGFIAVDLLRVDGTSLLDVPLLERKRQLESVIVPDRLLRISTHVRPPIDTWVATWKAMGLRGGMLKAANSRYHPNDDTIEWRVVERLGKHR
jgi:ATP-dependent DNA ligase